VVGDREEALTAAPWPDDEVISKELSGLGETVRGVERRMAEVERVNVRLEDAALTKAPALQESSGHWDAVYEAMRRSEIVDPEEELVKARLAVLVTPRVGNQPAPGDRSYGGPSALG
jgi:hypothetical protein